MSAIRTYVAELKRQADLLERAADYDSRYYGPAPTPQPQGRRHWTRQDRNRCDWQCAVEDTWEGERAAFERICESMPRMRTRVDWFIKRFRREPHSIRLLHAAALADARDQGIYDTLAPLIVAATFAHGQLLDGFDRQTHEDNGFLRRDEAEIEWQRAMTELKYHLPIEPDLTPDEDRTSFVLNNGRPARHSKKSTRP